jgi:hypothetical protein
MLKSKNKRWYFIITGATYLQSSRAEAECVSFMTLQLCRENAFRIHKFAAEIAASDAMRNAAETFIQCTFGPVLALVCRQKKNGRYQLADFLAAPTDRWRRVLSDNVQVGEDLLFYALLGWIEHDIDARYVGVVTHHLIIHIV